MQLTQKQKARRENESYGEYAYRVLRDKIMKFDLVPGTNLNESEIADALNISRTPVHEAVTRLKDENLVIVEPRKETYVSKIDLVRVNDGVFIRGCVEPALITSTQGNVSASIMQRMLQNINLQKHILVNGNEFNEFNETDDEFHKLLYLAANRENTYVQVRKMVTHFDRVRYLARRDGGFEGIDANSFLEHKEIFGAVAYCSQLSADAQTLVRRHITRFQSSMDHIMEKYADYFLP